MSKLVQVLRDYQMWMAEGPSIGIDDIDGEETFGAAADRIEVLEAQHANDCEEIAKWREIFSGRTISENFEVVWRERLKRSEAKLAKAVESLEKLARLGNGDRYGTSDGNMIARTTLAELKGAEDADRT